VEHHQRISALFEKFVNEVCNEILSALIGLQVGFDEEENLQITFVQQ
jgi:hypothetical protein